MLGWLRYHLIVRPRCRTMLRMYVEDHPTSIEPVARRRLVPADVTR